MNNDQNNNLPKGLVKSRASSVQAASEGAINAIASDLIGKAALAIAEGLNL